MQTIEKVSNGWCDCMVISCFRPLQRMVCGMVLAGLAFLLAGFVQLRVEVGTMYAQKCIHMLRVHMHTHIQPLFH